MHPGHAGGGAALARTLLKRVLPSCEQKVLLVDFAVYSPAERRAPGVWPKHLFHLSLQEQSLACQRHYWRSTLLKVCDS